MRSREAGGRLIGGPSTAGIDAKGEGGGVWTNGAAGAPGDAALPPPRSAGRDGGGGWADGRDAPGVLSGFCLLAADWAPAKSDADKVRRSPSAVAERMWLLNVNAHHRRRSDGNATMSVNPAPSCFFAPHLIPAARSNVRGMVSQLQ